MLTVRTECADDAVAIHAVHAAAFPTPAEAQLVDALRQSGRLLVSLVAEHDGRVVGHVGFSAVTVAGAATDGLGLAPLGVRPERQGQGIGERLVREGLAACAARGAGFVVVLGEPGYYGCHGFRPARGWALADEYGGGDAFQALELRPGAIPSAGGLVQYAPEFSALEV